MNKQLLVLQLEKVTNNMMPSVESKFNQHAAMPIKMKLGSAKGQRRTSEHSGFNESTDGSVDSSNSSSEESTEVKSQSQKK